VLGANHPHTLNAVCSLALLLHAQGKLAEAEPLYRRALAGKEQQLSAQHPSTLTSVNNQGRATIPPRARGLRTANCERQLGAQHLSMLITVDNRASLLQAQGKLPEAEPLFRRYAGSCEMVISA